MNVLEFPAASEAFVTKAELAKLLHVSRSTINRWMVAGMPYEKWGPKICRYEPSKVRQWAREHGRMAA